MKESPTLKEGLNNQRLGSDKMSFANQVGQNLACEFSAFYRLDKDLFNECLDGMPAYSSCVIAAYNTSTLQYEAAYFLPQGNTFDKSKLKALFEGDYEYELIFFSSTINKIPVFGLPGFKTIRLQSLDMIGSCSNLIASEATRHKLFRDQILNNALEKLTLYILREFHDNHSEIFDQINEHFENDRLIRILVYIHEHMEEEVSLEHLANMVELSPDYISQFFKRCLGMSIQAYLIEQRVSMGFYYLISTADPIAQISDNTGFVDQAYFNRRFKIVYGMNPLRIRKKYQLLFISQAGVLMTSAK